MSGPFRSKYLDDLGGRRTYNHYPTGWACAFNTPFKLWKRYYWEGGTADPLIVSWPSRISGRGLRRQYVHAIDIVPTIYECLNVEPPETVKGYTQHPIEGISFGGTFEDADAAALHPDIPLRNTMSISNAKVGAHGAPGNWRQHRFHTRLIARRTPRGNVVDRG